MKITCTFLFFAFLISGCSALLGSKSNKGSYPSKLQRETYIKEFSDIPYHSFLEIQSQLDSLIHARYCFRFIKNRDSTRFVALFSLRHDDPAGESYGRWGGGYSYGIWPKGKDSIRYINYALWGMKFNDKWYYSRDGLYQFTRPSLEIAQENFEFMIMKEKNNFFAYYLTEHENEFWQRGGDPGPKGKFYGQFEVVNYSWALIDESESSLPEAVKSGKWDSIRVMNYRNERTKRNYIIQKINKVSERDIENSIYVFNRDTSQFVIQTALPRGHNWVLRYYYFEYNDSNLYQWVKYPEMIVSNLDTSSLIFSKQIGNNTLDRDRMKLDDIFWNSFKEKDAKLINKNSG